MGDASHRANPEKRVHRLPPANGRTVPLAIQEVAPASGKVRPTPVVLLHGATFGAAMFDIPVSNYSLQAYLAARGWRTFALDVRGYGRSTPSAVLDAPPEANEPFARHDDAVDDLAAAIAFALDQAGVETAHVMGFSWGTVVACVLAARDAGLFEKLVLYAPLYGEVNDLWLDRIADRAERTRIDPRLGAYRWVAEADVRLRWDADIPVGARVEDYREEAVLRAIVDTLAASDPGAGTRPEIAFRAPTGALVDLFEVFNGRPLYDAGRISVPTLVVRGQDDTTSTPSDALALFDALGTTQKRYVAIAPGSHFLCAERNALDLFGEIDLFLGR